MAGAEFPKDEVDDAVAAVPKGVMAGGPDGAGAPKGLLLVDAVFPKGLTEGAAEFPNGVLVGGCHADEGAANVLPACGDPKPDVVVGPVEGAPKGFGGAVVPKS